MDKALNEKIAELEAKIRLLEAELLSTRNKESESRLRRAEIASRTGNWDLHLDTGMMYGSEGALLLYGMKKTEMKYEDIKGIPLPEFRPLLNTALKELISDNKPYNVEFKIRNAETGEVFDIHSTAEYDRENRTVFGVIRDITDRKASEEQIRTRSENLAVLLKITMDLLEKADRRSVLQNILEGTASLVRLETGAIYTIEGENLTLESTIPPLPDSFPDEFRKALIKNHPHIANALAAQNPVIVPDISRNKLTPEEVTIIANRDMRSLLFIPLIASGQNYGIIILGSLGRIHKFEENEIAICRTISNIASLALENSILIANLKSARDRAEESDKLKTAFLHNISHEIRTPLNAIIGFSSFLDQPELTSTERRKFIDIIQQSNNQLLNIINDIFNVSHIEAGQVILKENITDIENILSNLYIQFLPEADKRGLDLKLELKHFNKDGCKVITDEGKLIQVLSNFLGNAMKFTSRGHITLGCSKDKDGLLFFVEDTGIGIPESEHSKIFDRFYQVEKTVSRAYSGAGLGLSISDAYVRLLGGVIHLESAPGKGSRFWFKIPVTDQIPAVNKSGSKKGSNIDLSGRKKTILIAEDERSNYLLLELMMKSLDATIMHAANGREAVIACSSVEHLDLVLMDIKMPVMDGYTATSEIKKIRPDLTIIALTAYTENNEMEKAYNSGCSEFLSKPVNKAQLLAVVNKYLNQ
jgi:PAS domain S-box-containing protein